MTTSHPLGPLQPLAAYRQFIVYRAVPMPGDKTNKIPHSAITGAQHSAHDPKHHVDYDTAVAAAGRLGADFRVGFALTKAAGIWCVDIDGCWTGTEWSQVAREVRGLLRRSVCEVSQSGKGLHIWGRGPIPDHRNRNSSAGLELYSDRQFIAFGYTKQATGELADNEPGIATVVERYFQPMVNDSRTAEHGDGPVPGWVGPTDDNELIRQFLASQSPGQVFGGDGGGNLTNRDLFEHNTEALVRAFPSKTDIFNRSSADITLAIRLLVRTGRDKQRTKRLMLRPDNRLRRDYKYERPPSRNGDYLDLTIDNALRWVNDKGLGVYGSGKASPAVDATTSAANLKTLEAIRDPEELKRQWLPLALDMTPADRESAVEHVAHYTLAGVRAVKATLKEAAAQRDDAARAEALQKRAGTRTMIPWRPEASSDLAAQVESLIVASADPGEYVQFGGSLAHVAIQHLPHTVAAGRPGDQPPPVPQIEPLDDVAIRARVERVAVFFETDRRDKSRRLIGVPDRIVDTLRDKSNHTAPTLAGLLSHPVVLPSGEILGAEGLHIPSGLFLRGLSLPEARPFTQSEAGAALARLIAVYLAEFEFASHTDYFTALAALFTGVQRRVLDKAPGVALLAAIQSSGKTTLAQRMHVALTGQDMPISSFPLNNEEEVSKRLLSALMRNPAMVCFDNVPDGFTFHSGALSAAITAPTLTQRVLGVSRDVTVPTNTLFVLTGNNLSFGNDEVTRWLVSRLAPKRARPEERKFRNPDTVAYALAHRRAILADVLGIVAGYLASGARFETGSRFPSWDRMVRQPIMWASGGHDVAEVFRKNADESETVRSHRGLLQALSRLFPGGQWFTSRKVCERVMSPAPDCEPLRAALDGFPIRDATKPKSVGHLLNGNIGRPATLDSGDVMLQSRINSDKVAEFRVVPARQ